MVLQRTVLFAALIAAPAWAEPAPPTLRTGAASETARMLEALPVEFSAFGDIRYRIEKGAPDRFEIGSVELDTALELTRHVTVSSAIAYDADRDGFGLPAFTVDGSLLGPEPKHLVHSDIVDDSGLVFGKFDVPFGIAYLEYAPTDNRFVELAGPIQATHGGWNDIGAQLYASAPLFELSLYLVNGDGLEAVDAARGVKHAVGGRVGLKPLAVLAFGASAAGAAGDPGAELWGGDLSASAGPFELKNECVLRRTEGRAAVYGYTGQLLAHYARVFAGVRSDAWFQGKTLAERELDLSVGAEVFPRAEVRVVHRRGFESDTQTTFLQIVGGSVWQPTGLRR